MDTTTHTRRPRTTLPKGITVKLQTCRRHPSAGRFMATCSGCAQELHDIQDRNEAMAIARTAIAILQGMQHAEILDAKRTNTGHLIVATIAGPQRHTDLPYGIDVFRPATAAETDPEQTDPLPAGTWVLVDQWGADTAPEHAEQWATARREYTRRGECGSEHPRRNENCVRAAAHEGLHVSVPGSRW